eukprot:4468021-Pyramimonas_sp.AAC.1
MTYRAVQRLRTSCPRLERRGASRLTVAPLRGPPGASNGIVGRRKCTPTRYADVGGRENAGQVAHPTRPSHTALTARRTRF